ncbi:hypothetical protein GCM10010230_22470 [Streptomyces narbonensis]|nr:hypothetical protein GCM10010230_22470 [Streptomyces narbonensis]
MNTRTVPAGSEWVVPPAASVIFRFRSPLVCLLPARAVSTGTAARRQSANPAGPSSNEAMWSAARE